MADMERRGMIERVARAIYSAYVGPEPLSDWGRISARDHEMHRRLARAAIEAMREPTEEMREVAPRWLAGDPSEVEWAKEAGAEMFAAMVDIALSIPPDDTGKG